MMQKMTSKPTRSMEFGMSTNLDGPIGALKVSQGFIADKSRGKSAILTGVSA